MNAIEIFNGEDISDTSSLTGVVHQEILNVSPLAVTHPLGNLIILGDSSKYIEGSIRDGIEPSSPHLWGNTHAYA